MKIYFSSIMLFIAFTAMTQRAKVTEADKYPLVKVKDWSNRVMMMSEEGWSENKDQIIRQVGEEKYAEIRKYQDWRNIPEEMSISIGNKLKKREDVYKKMDSLKVVYKIVTYNYVYQGKPLRRQVILEVPYKGNEDWDKKAKWHSVYFILDEKDVEEFPEKYPLVRIKDWGEQTMTMSEDGWSENKYQIIEQVGEKEYEEIRKNYDWKSIPEEMTLFNGKKKKNKETLYKKLDSLKVIYKIVTYNYIYEGKIKDRRVILKIPYKGNEDWDKNVKWSNVYILIPEEVIEIIK